MHLGNLFPILGSFPTQDLTWAVFLFRRQPPLRQPLPFHHQALGRSTPFNQAQT